MDIRDDIKKKIIEISENGKTGGGIRTVLTPIIERYLIDQGAETVRRSLDGRWQLYVTDGFGKYTGKTCFKIVQLITSNAYHLRDRINPVHERGIPVKNLILIVMRRISPELQKQLEEHYAEVGVMLEIWDLDQVAEIIACYPSLYSECLQNLKEQYDTEIESAVREAASHKKDHDESIIVYEIRNHIQENGVALFLGAGVSRDCGIPNWNELLQRLYISKVNEELKKNNMGLVLSPEAEDEVIEWLKGAKGTSQLIQARYLKNGFGSEPDEFQKEVRDVLYKKCEKGKVRESKLLSVIGDICGDKNQGKIDTIITYNYDDLVETALEIAGKKCRPVYRDGTYRIWEGTMIYHVHGYLPTEEIVDEPAGRMIFSEDEYHKLMAKPYDWANLIQINTLMGRTCIFIGLSMTDPNLRRLLDLLSADKQGHHPTHYAFLKRETFEIKDASKGLEEFLNANTQWQERVFEELGIKIVWVNDYEEIPQILTKVFAD